MPLQLGDILDMCRVPEAGKWKLKDHDPAWAGDESVPKKERRARAENILASETRSLAEDQELLYAADSWAVLVVLQAMDAAGKDGTIAHVMSGVNPQGCQVFSFKQPSAEELDHNFLWRYSKALPERGRIGIFNRSYYEEVLVVRVHPELVRRQRIPGAKIGESFWRERFDDINAFERHLTRNGTLVLKFFLHVSKEEQKQRFLKRIEDPAKHWKFSAADLAERGYWDDYMEAYEDALSATSTEWAPWYVVPADQKWVTRVVVADVLTSAIQGLDLKFPEITDEQRQVLKDARKQLKHEGENGNKKNGKKKERKNGKDDG